MEKIKSEQAKAAFAEAKKAFLGEADRLGLEDIDDVVAMINGVREERECRENIEEYDTAEIDWGDPVGKEQC